MGFIPISIKNHENHDTFDILWYIGKLCNFDCTYCSPELHDNISNHRSLAELLEAWTKLKKISSGKRKVISISGGEPTLNPHLLDFFQALKTDGQPPYKIILTTNGSKSADYYCKALKLVDHITISIHFESINQDRYLKLVNDLSKNEIESRKIKLNLMCDPGRIPDLKKFIAKIDPLNVPYIIRRIRPTLGAVNPEPIYENDEIDFFTKSDPAYLAKRTRDIEINYIHGDIYRNEMTSIEFFNLNGLSSFKGWKCDAGVNSLTIWSNGDLKRCEKVSLEYGGPLNIYRDEISEITLGPITCPSETCVCIADVAISKYNPNY